MAQVGNRQFSADELRSIFRTLDSGGRRDDVRATVRRLQGRGVSNDTIKDLRELHRQVRRSQGYNVKVGSTRNLRDEGGRLRPLSTLRPDQRVAQSRRPLPPPGARVVVQVPVVDPQGRVTELRTAPEPITITDRQSFDDEVRRLRAEEAGYGTNRSVFASDGRIGAGPRIVAVEFP